MRDKRWMYGAAAVGLAAVLLFSTGMGKRSGDGNGQSPREVQQVQKIVIEDRSGFSGVISQVAATMIPTVVHINITGTVVQEVPDIPFFRFFDGPRQREVPIQALGSGVIVSEQGHIITNYHVISEADEIEVTLSDGTSHRAEMVGSDPQTDLAVIKIDPVEGMRYARFGDSDELEIGEWVIAIGSPRGLQQTVTAGIVSAKGRNLGVLGPQGYEDFIQTDAAINPGNSGGPLISLEGEVVGINSLIVSTGQGFQGMGFAIPANMVREISESLIQTGEVIRGFLGVQIQNITPEMRRSLGLDDAVEGIIVADVTPGGPAEQAGLQQGDIIVGYRGDPVENTSELRNRVAGTEPGTRVRVTVLRDGSRQSFTVTVGNLNEFQEARAQRTGQALGLTVQPVDEDTARSLGMRSATGVVVTSVEPGSPAARAGLSRGVVILRVGRTPVSTVEEFRELAQRMAPQGQVLLLVYDPQSDRTAYVTVPVQ
ncbi:MAG: Do family serine endopeptidase [Spirochaetota bacterium]